MGRNRYNDNVSHESEYNDIDNVMSKGWPNA